MAFIVSVITVYNLRMLDLFRYGASLESWSGHLFLCIAIAWYFLKPTKLCGPLLIVGATYWLVCSGHPQMMYYGLVGAGFFTLLVPYFIRLMLPDMNTDSPGIPGFWLRAGLCCAVGILLSSAYVLPFYLDCVDANPRQCSLIYAAADIHRHTLMGTLNNFFQPFLSNVHSAFGGSSLFLVAAIIPVLSAFRVGLPRVIWLIWGLSLFVFLYMQGGRMPIHYLVWEYVPFASHFRIAGRVTMILPILFMMELAWIMKAGAVPIRFAGREAFVSPRLVLALIALLLVGVYFCLPDSIVSDGEIYTAKAIRQIQPWVMQGTMMLGLGALALLAIHGFFARAKWVTELFLCLITCALIMGFLEYGTWVGPNNDTPSFIQWEKWKQDRLDRPPMPGTGSGHVAKQHLMHSPLEPFLAKYYRKSIYADSSEQAYVLMEKGRAPDQVIVEGLSNLASQPHEGRELNESSDKVELTYSSFNRLAFDVRAAVPGFLVLAYPDTGRWKALVNGQRVRIYRANGAAQAVRLAAGRSDVEFRYWSSMSVLGAALSCAAFVLIGLTVCFLGLRRGLLRVFIATAVLSAGCGGFALWYNSLYGGENLGTVYAWGSSPPARPANLAYGKRTEASTTLEGYYPMHFNAGRAVDGDGASRNSYSFISDLEPRPWWLVDLYGPELIGSIVIYEGRKSRGWNTRPITVSLSMDGEKWQTVGSVSKEQSGAPLQIVLEKPLKGKYVRVQSLGACRLAITEVEIYPPAEKNFR
ncbi:MAG: hypothetical protein GY864_13265 [Desulfobacterales bacterium]|nr:hypothetical protein [Desulfobacterales bacterium]